MYIAMKFWWGNLLESDTWTIDKEIGDCVNTKYALVFGMGLKLLGILSIGRLQSSSVEASRFARNIRQCNSVAADRTQVINLFTRLRGDDEWSKWVVSFISLIFCLFTYSLFNDACSNSNYEVPNFRINNELERIWKDAVVD
jgi:hypothetical protein